VKILVKNWYDISGQQTEQNVISPYPFKHYSEESPSELHTHLFCKKLHLKFNKLSPEWSTE